MNKTENITKERISFQELPADFMGSLLKLEQEIDSSGLDRKLLEMLRLRVAQLNSCAYCVDHHYKELRHHGDSELRAYSLSVWRETHYYSEKERLVLEFTERLTQLNEDAVSGELFDSLSAQFSKDEISYLTLAIAQINTWTRLMRTFRFIPGNYQVQS